MMIIAYKSSVKDGKNIFYQPGKNIFYQPGDLCSMVF